MRYGYWLPVFGGWLRNVDEEQMEATWDYASRLTQRSEEIGYDLTLIAELNLNDIKGVEAPSLDAWSTAAALAAVTSKLELMVGKRHGRGSGRPRAAGEVEIEQEFCRRAHISRSDLLRRGTWK